ncbi:hypothetical protein [Agrobacterium pusense]|uniref:hypothetical protein n=1 Tax=Agrobacterium pusense TaxID=648995 RepID=UPI000A7A7EEA|nr:hypothetical protein [Agrobacterium pusense]QWW75877.1 hypothetical protein KP800_21810 [Agrobacterium pusense]
MNSVETHLKRYPKSRPSKIAELAKRDETTNKLQREINARLPWWKRLTRRIAGRV